MANPSTLSARLAKRMNQTPPKPTTGGKTMTGQASGTATGTSGGTTTGALTGGGSSLPTKQVDQSGVRFHNTNAGAPRTDTVSGSTGTMNPHGYQVKREKFQNPNAGQGGGSAGWTGGGSGYYGSWYPYSPSFPSYGSFGGYYGYPMNAQYPQYPSYGGYNYPNYYSGSFGYAPDYSRWLGQYGSGYGGYGGYGGYNYAYPLYR